jgi:membrane protease YdiL (CAAX protease family)
VIVLSGWCIYWFLLQGKSEFVHAAAAIHTKVSEFGIDTAWEYALLAGFYSLAHSLLEEYYWRWFVFGQLRGLSRPLPAVAVSAAAFAGHHVIVLSAYFGGWTLGTALLSAAVGAGGIFWAWLYERSGSLLGPWLSHLLIDAGIFWIGYELLRESLY